MLQIKGTRSFRVKKGGSLSSIRRAGSLKSTKLSRQDSESENEELQLSHSRDTVTDIGNLDKWVEREGTTGSPDTLRVVAAELEMPGDPHPSRLGETSSPLQGRPERGPGRSTVQILGAALAPRAGCPRRAPG